MRAYPLQVAPQRSARLLEFLAALLQRGVQFVVLGPEDDDLAGRKGRPQRWPFSVSEPDILKQSIFLERTVIYSTHHTK